MARDYKPRVRKVRPIRIEGEVAYIQLTQGHEAVIDVADVHLIEGRNWSYRAAWKTGYAQAGAVIMHRVLVNAPAGMQVDHINGDGLDNRRANLRLATPSQNSQNIGKRRTNTSGYKGVSRCANSPKWRAQIRSADKTQGCNGKVYLGVFDTPEQAYAAYCEANRRLHGDYGNLS
jgi:hypothetical protein